MARFRGPQCSKNQSQKSWQESWGLIGSHRHSYWLLQTTNTKSYAFSTSTPLLMTLSKLWGYTNVFRFTITLHHILHPENCPLYRNSYRVFVTLNGSSKPFKFIQRRTRSSTVAERPRYASCHWIFRWLIQGHSRPFEKTSLRRCKSHLLFHCKYVCVS